MSLSRTRASIRAIEAKDVISIYDVLAIFNDLCLDVKNDASMQVSDLALGKKQEVKQLLRANTRILLNIGKKHPELFEESGGERLRKMFKELELQDEKLEHPKIQQLTLAQRLEEIDCYREKLEEFIEKNKKEKEQIEEEEKKICISMLELE